MTLSQMRQEWGKMILTAFTPKDEHTLEIRIRFLPNVSMVGLSPPFSTARYSGLTFRMLEAPMREKCWDRFSDSALDTRRSFKYRLPRISLEVHFMTFHHLGVTQKSLMSRSRHPSAVLLFMRIGNARASCISYWTLPPKILSTTGCVPRKFGIR